MKLTSFLAAVGLAATANAHAIAHRIRINGADQGQLVGFRAPSSNYPIENVNSGDMACGTGGSKSSSVVNVPAGASASIFWGHVIGGAQFQGDPDNPIAASHKGPIQVYLAKVSDANSASSSGQRWFKIAHEGLNGGRWAVDTMISGGGWWNFQFPSCLASGHYLLRVELLALHSAATVGLAQFYVSCVQINIQNGGSFSPSSTVSFPGAYSATHPGIQIQIYAANGQPNNNGNAYSIPGPSPINCNGQSNGGGTTTTTARPQTTTGGSTGTGAPLYGQCGGIGWTGPTTCAQGRCVKGNDYYSQCTP